MTQEVDLRIDASGKEIDKSRLAWVMNEWDSYAVEEAVLLKEKSGGTVTVVTVGGKSDEEILWKCLAMGADKAVRIEPGAIVLDGYVISMALSQVVKQHGCDLVLTGVQADDHNDGVVGSMLAEHLGISHAAVVNSLKVTDGTATVRVELEGGVEEVFTLELPALLSIQTGINEPRYVSIMAVRRAHKKELEVIALEDLNLSEEDLSPRTTIEEIFEPPKTGGAKMIEGGLHEVAEGIIRILKEKGVME
jgi:electron transfer flavoprotein beta subunit